MDDLVFISYSSSDKAIADAVCHYLEEAGIRCWIAPRDIRQADWASAIMGGLHNSPVFVVIISKNSISSPEVAKEVTEATRTCSYLIPFKVDTEELSDRLRYHLGPCHWLDAVTPPLEARIRELISRIQHLSDEDALYLNQSQWQLVSHLSLPRGLFVGRDKEIDELAAAMATEHVVFLQGIGGLGKSEIAKGYANQYKDRYQTVIFSSYISGIKDLICSNEINIRNLKRFHGESLDSWYSRKIDALRSIVDEKTLLIIDNFDVDYDADLQDLIDLPWHILFTTRNDHSDFFTIQIGPITDLDTVRSIFSYHFGKQISPEDKETVNQILKLVACHTITVELIAKQMRASFIKPKKMLELLKKSGVNLHLKEKVKREGDEEKRSSFEYIRSLFSLSKLSAQEQHLMRCMCMVPLSGISVQEFGTILDLEDYEVVNGLIGKSWLILDDEDDIIKMHPIIHDVVKEELAPSPIVCIDYIKGLYRRVKAIWFFPEKEKSDLYPLVSFITRTYPIPDFQLLPEYSHFVNISWICGDFSLSTSAAEIVYRSVADHFGVNSMEAGQAALDCAGAWHNSGNEDNAEIWYQHSMESYRNASCQPNAKLAQCYFKIGRCCRLKKQFDEARAFYALAAAEYQTIIDRHLFPEGEKVPDQFLDLFLEKQRLLMDEGSYEDALKMCGENYQLNIATYGGENASTYYYLLDSGICYSRLGSFDNADAQFQHALANARSFHGSASLAFVHIYEAMADLAIIKGEIGQARDILNQISLSLEENYGENNPNTVRINNKLKALESG